MELDKFFKISKEVSLSEKEKADGKRLLLEFMKQHPVISGSQVRPGFWSSIFPINLTFVPTMAIVLVIAFLAGGGMAFSAEKALPGDVLYPVKVGINEEVRGWLKVSQESKANWEIERSHKRLEEAEKLAASGSLDAEARAVIEANFQAHADKVAGRIAKLETKENFNSAADVSSNFETSLSAHERILSRLMEKETDVKAKGEIKPIVVQVKSVAQAAKNNRKKNEKEISASGKAGIEVAAEGKLKAAENMLRETEKYIESVSENFNAETELQAEAKLEAAKTTIAYGKAKFEAKDYGAAFTSFQQAIRIAQEAKLLIAAGQDLKIDIGINGNIGGDDDGDSYNSEEEKESESGKTKLKLDLEL